MPKIEIDTRDRIRRHLAAVRLMTYMVFPENSWLRFASELTARVKLADWYSAAFDRLQKKKRQQYLRKLQAPHGELGEPSACLRERLFSKFLAPLGPLGGIVALAESPPFAAFEALWTRRWIKITCAARLMLPIGSIHEH